MYVPWFRCLVFSCVWVVFVGHLVCEGSLLLNGLLRSATVYFRLRQWQLKPGFSVLETTAAIVVFCNVGCMATTPTKTMPGCQELRSGELCHLAFCAAQGTVFSYVFMPSCIEAQTLARDFLAELGPTEPSPVHHGRMVSVSRQCAGQSLQVGLGDCHWPLRGSHFVLCLSKLDNPA